MGILSSATLSALLFAILHPQSLLGMPPLFIIGFWLSLLYEARMSIVGCVLAHALINLTSLALLTLFILLR
jgi:membrane protease YdiL (CAAX protease family)